MTVLLPAAPQLRRAYDHRIREHVCRTGARSLGHGLHVPRSTISSWKRRGLRAVVSLEVFEQDRQQLFSTVEKLDRRVRILAATVRLLLALLRASGFRLAGERLPEGNTKASILRAITSAVPALPLPLVLRIVGLPSSRYHAWRRVAVVCGLDDRSPCPRTTPWPTHRRRGRRHQGHGPRARVPPHAPAHPEPLRPAHRQGLRLRDHLGTPHSRAWLAPPSPSRSSRQTHRRHSGHRPERNLAHRCLRPQAARRHQSVHPRDHRQLLEEDPGLDHSRASIPPPPARCSSTPADISPPSPAPDQRSRSWPTRASRTSTPPSTPPSSPHLFTASSPRSRSPSPTR